MQPDAPLLSAMASSTSVRWPGNRFPTRVVEGIRRPWPANRGFLVRTDGGAPVSSRTSPRAKRSVGTGRSSWRPGQAPPARDRRRLRWWPRRLWLDRIGRRSLVMSEQRRTDDDAFLSDCARIHQQWHERAKSRDTEGLL